MVWLIDWWSVHMLQAFQFYCGYKKNVPRIQLALDHWCPLEKHLRFVIWLKERMINCIEEDLDCDAKLGELLL